MSQGNNKRFAGVRVLIFDLDGTLIDSKLDLALSVNAARTHLGMKELAHETIFGFVGQGAPTLIRRSLGEGASDADVERGLAYFLQYYREHMLDNTVAYPGVREGLDQLEAACPGQPMAVLTNKPERFSKRILEGLGMAKYFQYVYGGNSFERKKPDPMGVEVLLRDYGAAPREAMMVGDSEIDVLTARNSGIWVCGVTYGLGSHLLAPCTTHVPPCATHPPDLLLDNLNELPAHLGAGQK